MRGRRHLQSCMYVKHKAPLVSYRRGWLTRHEPPPSVAQLVAARCSGAGCLRLLSDDRAGTQMSINRRHLVLHTRLPAPSGRPVAIIRALHVPQPLQMVAARCLLQL